MSARPLHLLESEFRLAREIWEATGLPKALYTMVAVIDEAINSNQFDLLTKRLEEES